MILASRATKEYPKWVSKDLEPLLRDFLQRPSTNIHTVKTNLSTKRYNLKNTVWNGEPPAPKTAGFLHHHTKSTRKLIISPCPLLVRSILPLHYPPASKTENGYLQ